MALVLVCLAPSARALAQAQQQALAQAAAQAQQQCYALMYRDTNAYAQCIRNLRNSPSATPLQKLGAEYFGFVGALSYMRVGHTNSEQIAWEFLRAFRQTQKRVGVADAALCSTVPGDCTVRMAQTRAMEAAPPPKAQSMRMQCINAICKLVPVP